MTKTTRIYLGVLMLIVFFISLIPAFHIRYSAGKEWRGVMPEYIEDSAYYYSRIHDVVRGHPLIGNPYFIEHKDELPPAFFISDWLASIPFFINSSTFFSAVFNIVVWSQIFIFLLYFLFRKMSVHESVSILFSLIVYLQIFWLLVRPVSMQVIFPAYLLFLFAIFSLLNDSPDKKRKWLLVFSTIYSIYVYTYLMQLVVMTYGIIVMYYLYKKNYQALMNLGRILSIVLISCIPFFIVTYFQTSHHLYLETLTRIGLLKTHIPRMELYYYGRWVVFVLVIWFLSRKFFEGFRTEEREKLFLFLSLTGVSLLLTAGSNVFTGKELELANHLGRFITLWFPIAFTTYLFTLYRVWREESETVISFKKIFILAFVLLGILVMIRNVPRAFPFFRNTQNSFVSIQSFKGPIVWLEKNIREPSVVLASDKFSTYIPIETRHYVLFHPSAFLQIVSDEELEERYLVSRFLDGGATRERIENDIGIYGGAGKALKGSFMQNHFDEMYEHYKKNIEKNISSYLEAFKVNFIVIDSHNETEIYQMSKLSSREVYRDNNFVIYKLLP